MTDEEISKLISYSLLLWPNQRDLDRVEQIVAWRALLADVDTAAARAVLDEYAATGAEFAPPPGWIRRHALVVVNQTGAPSPDEAWEEVGRKIASIGYAATVHDVCHLGRACLGKECGHHTVTFSHPAIQAVVDSMGWRELCLSTEPMPDRAHFMKFYAVAVERLTKEVAKPPSMIEFEGSLPAISGPPATEVRALPSGSVDDDRDNEEGLEQLRAVRETVAKVLKRIED